MALRRFLKKLSELGEMTSVSAPIDTHLELAALCRREFTRQNGGQALLFKQLTDSSIAVVANLFGSEKRLSLMLNSASLSDFEYKTENFLQAGKGSSGERLRLPNFLNDTVSSPLKTVCDYDLRCLPAIRSWPQEVGRYLTLALATTCHPESGETNLGLYRAQIVSAGTLAVNFAPGSGAARHLEAARHCGLSMPISLILGSDPGLFWVAAAPLPQGCNEYAFYRALLNPELPLTAGDSQPLVVPADAEIVLEGEIRPGETVREGPFGNHSGQYVSRRDCPLMRVTAVRLRENPIMPVTVVGPPPSENIYLAKANEILIREILKIDFPQITTLMMPQETFFHSAAIMTVKQQTPVQIRDLIYALWQDSPLNRSRLLVLLDEDIDLCLPTQCWWRTINRLQDERIFHDQGRMAIDATGVDPSTLVIEDQETQQLLQRRREEYNLS